MHLLSKAPSLSLSLSPSLTITNCHYHHHHLCSSEYLPPPPNPASTMVTPTCLFLFPLQAFSWSRRIHEFMNAFYPLFLIYICIRPHTRYTQIQIQIQIHYTYIYTYKVTCMHTFNTYHAMYACICNFNCTETYMYTYIHTFSCMHTCTVTYIHNFMHTFIYIA